MNKGKWKKGQSGNPRGRPPGKTSAEILIAALVRQGKKRGQKWEDRVAEMFWTSERVMVAVLSKIIADLQKIDNNVSGGLTVTINRFGDNDPK